MIAGTNSGCGKTTMVCALLQALVNRGLTVGACKCGPDYIDPMFHSRIIGARSSNLDSFFFTDDTVRYLLEQNSRGCDITVIEGVMGFYDGLEMESTKASTYEMSEITQSPVILAVNARGASQSVLAVIRGFADYLPNRIKGVILNRCSAMTYQVLAKAIRAYFGGCIEPLGYLPLLPECSLESRHLGLVTAAEVRDLKTKMQLLSAQAEKSLDLDRILSLAQEAAQLCAGNQPVLPFSEPVRIGIARDEAFCFYYEDSLSVLWEMGAELVSFSPLRDCRLPEDLHGIYLGGGYPELYAEQLSRNRSMRENLKAALEKQIPCIAECGGFMYLTEQINDFPQTGYLPGRCFDTGSLRRFGYVTLRAKEDSMLCREGEEIRGHEFHHYDADDTGDGFTASKKSGKSWDCVHVSDHLYAGFPHFHFRANLHFAERFYEACSRYKKRNLYD